MKDMDCERNTVRPTEFIFSKYCSVHFHYQNHFMLSFAIFNTNLQFMSVNTKVSSNDLYN